jgi:hypothetical protein
MLPSAGTLAGCGNHAALLECFTQHNENTNLYSHPAPFPWTISYDVSGLPRARRATGTHGTRRPLMMFQGFLERDVQQEHMVQVGRPG